MCTTMCSYYDVPTLEFFCQCIAVQFREFQEEASARSAVYILYRLSQKETHEKHFLWHVRYKLHTLEENRLTDDRGKDHGKPCEERKLKKYYALHTLQIYSSVLKF